MTLKVVDHPMRQADMKKSVFNLDGCKVTFEADSDITLKDFFWYLEQCRQEIWDTLKKAEAGQAD